MTLKDTTPGMTVRIDELQESPLKQRLMTMGLIPGTKVEILNSAPMGDPIAIRIRSYNLAMRKDDAANIKVTVI
ncbi:MAG: ferrous iron transport protein A [Selenomonadaceae bacterium]|nr:ferrous iron transport protein A [Selenomonadaceae bacterium]